MGEIVLITRRSQVQILPPQPIPSAPSVVSDGAIALVNRGFNPKVAARRSVKFQRRARVLDAWGSHPSSTLSRSCPRIRSLKRAPAAERAGCVESGRAAATTRKKRGPSWWSSSSAPPWKALGERACEYKCRPHAGPAPASRQSGCRSPPGQLHNSSSVTFRVASRPWSGARRRAQR